MIFWRAGGLCYAKSVTVFVKQLVFKLFLIFFVSGCVVGGCLVVLRSFLVVRENEIESGHVFDCWRLLVWSDVESEDVKQLLNRWEEFCSDMLYYMCCLFLYWEQNVSICVTTQ